MQRDEKNARDAGDDFFVIKPVENQILKLHVNDLIRKSITLG
ncbi:hypothetical protein ASZ90_004483 [hydrocarbon metagenome]|uniref:Response regulatory domain-containing protein n=1 Tax=hydrocarbon metagenome TaxID=938273 RepID=A0A0W8FXY8_9ZZZZ